MVHASLGLKSLSSFIRSSSQTHTESADGVSDLNYLLWAYKSWAAPGCCAEELGSGDTPGCFRRRCGSSRANARQPQLHTRDLGWYICGGQHLPKLPVFSAHASSVPSRERSAPAQQGRRLLPEAPLELADA